MPASSTFSRPPAIEAERPQRRFSCSSFAEAKGMLTVDRWEAAWKRACTAPNPAARLETLVEGAKSLRWWLGNCELPRIMPATHEAFKNSGFMRWYTAVANGIQALPYSQEREDAALFLKHDVLPLLMLIDPLLQMNRRV